MRVSTASIVRREANCFTSKDHALTTRFATEKTIPNFPSSSLFTDRYNHNWKVVIDKKDDTVNMFIPCGTQMLWYGADESPTRTGSDAQTQWASVQFSWQDKTYLPPFHAGVRIAFSGYKDKTTGEWSVDTERWNNILDLSKKGLEVTGAALEQIEKGAAIASGLPKPK